MEVLWNMFSFYVLIITRINCTADFALRKNFQRTIISKSNKDNKPVGFEKADPKKSKIYNNNLPSAPKPVVPITGGLFCSNCNRDLSRDINAISATGHLLSSLKHSFKGKVKSSGSGDGIKSNRDSNKEGGANSRRSNADGIESDTIVGDIADLTLYHEMSKSSNKLYSCESRWMSIERNCSDFGYCNLILFALNLLMSLFFVIKLTAHSLAGVYLLSDDIQVNEKGSDISGNRLILWPSETITNNNNSIKKKGFFQTLLILITCDIFGKFNNSSLLNIFALTILLPSTLIRCRSMRQVVQKICRDPNCDGPDQSEMSIVQLNLSYLNELSTTIGKWKKLIRHSAFHQHSYKTLQEEAAAILRVISIKDGSQTCIDIKTKMYAYNMIQFNSCFSEYFSADPDEELNSESDVHNDKVELPTNDADSMAQPSLEGKLSTIDHSSVRSVNIKPETRPSIQLTARERKEDIFVAKPIHRIDLNLMFWLLTPMLLFYVVWPLMTVGTSWAAININCREVVYDPSETFTHWNIDAVSVGKVIQLVIWRGLNSLATFDMYFFFSCCLICFSRVRYLRKILSQFLEACIELTSKMADSKLAVEGYVIEMEGKFSNMAEILNYKVKKADICTLNNKEFGTRYVHTINLNQKAEFIIDLALLLQFELADLKRFFTNYLNAELSLKIVGTVFAVTALLECGSVYEFIFNMITCFNATIPLLLSLIMAALIEYEFRSICKLLSRVLACGSQVITPQNMKRMTKQVDHLTIKTNRSFVVANYFSVSVGGLATLFGWIVTGVLLLRR